MVSFADDDALFTVVSYTILTSMLYTPGANPSFGVMPMLMVLLHPAPRYETKVDVVPDVEENAPPCGVTVISMFFTAAFPDVFFTVSDNTKSYPGSISGGSVLTADTIIFGRGLMSG